MRAAKTPAERMREKRALQELVKTNIELEADNNVLISIVERNIGSMHSAVRLLRLEMKNGASYIHTLENIVRLEDDIDRSRKFLDKLYQEGRYPPPP